MDFLAAYSFLDLFWIGLSLFLIGMSKGGFPVGAVALPILILVWPVQAHSARAAVGFMLPMLCLMDIVALCFYWKYVKWGRLIYLIPATLTGVVVASYLFVSDSAMISVSDKALKLLIGLLGIVFVIYFALNQIAGKRMPGIAESDAAIGAQAAHVAELFSTQAARQRTDGVNSRLVAIHFSAMMNQFDGRRIVDRRLRVGRYA